MAKSLPVDRAYETLLIFPADIPQKTIDTFIEKIKSTLAPAKGVLRGVQVWGRRRLTYPVKHQKDGLYVYIDYTGMPTAPQALKTLFHVTDFVLRHLTTDKVVMRPPYRPRVATPETAAAPAAPEQSAAAAAAPTAVETKELPSA
jgi:small subunit ribosomal protein S6